jgi:hypothetical protein
MKKLLTLMLAGLALALPITAMADSCTLMHAGSKTSSRAATGSCSTRNGAVPGVLVLRCDGLSGYAVARYDFKMPDSWCGNAKEHVDVLSGNFTSSIVKLDDSHVRVIVRTSGPSKVVISSVSVGFYT